jgi:uracil-DNA glycosylase
VNVTDYLLESGSDVDRPWHVHDLAPAEGAAELVFVFESPHFEELRAGLPVVGAAGRSALRLPAARSAKGREPRTVR